MNTILQGAPAALMTATLCLAGAHAQPAYAQSAPAQSGAASQASPTPSNVNGAPVGPLTASALHTPGLPDEPAHGPFSFLSNKLGNYGISLRGVLIDQYANNPDGGVHQGGDNVGQLSFGADVDLQKMVGLPGGSFHITVYRDYGLGLAKTVTGTFVKQQNDYKNPYPQLHLGLFAYEQKLFDDRLDIIGGRLGTTPFYGHLVPACSFQSGATCGVPAILNSEAGFSLLPSATWGTNITAHLSRDVYFETGAFEVNPSTSATNGMNWSTADATGVTIPFELGWAKPSLRAVANPFELKAGGYISTAPHADPFYSTRNRSLGLFGGTARSDPTRDGIYLMGDRVVWRPDRDGSENLNLFGGIIQPLEDEEIVSREVYSGVLLTGAIPGRPRDSIGLSATYFQVSPREIEFLRDARIKAGGSGSNKPDQGVFELNYGIQVIPHLRLTPNIQYIANPDNSNIPKTRILPKNILVFGLYLSLGFSNILGFNGSGPAAD